MDPDMTGALYLLCIEFVFGLVMLGIAECLMLTL